MNYELASMLTDYFCKGEEVSDRLLEAAELPWDPLKNLKSTLATLLEELGPRVPEGLHPSIIIKGLVHIEEGAILEENVYIAGPTFIGKGAEVRFGAYIRGNVLVDRNCVVGHDTEIKHSALFPGAKAAHFAYVGDSILGRDVNLGAGTKMANVKVDMGKSSVRVRLGDKIHDSGLRKFGAILGDNVSLGCNTVTNPGTVIGRNTLSYPLANLSGAYPADTIIKVRQQQTRIERRAPV